MNLKLIFVPLATPNLPLLDYQVPLATPHLDNTLMPLATSRKNIKSKDVDPRNLALVLKLQIYRNDLPLGYILHRMYPRTNSEKKTLWDLTASFTKNKFAL